MGQEDPLEKEMATLSSILAWEIPWKEGPGGLNWRATVHRVTKSQTQRVNNNICHTKSKILTTSSFIEKVCRPLFKMIPFGGYRNLKGYSFENSNVTTAVSYVYCI